MGNAEKIFPSVNRGVNHGRPVSHSLSIWDKGRSSGTRRLNGQHRSGHTRSCYQAYSLPTTPGTAPGSPPGPPSRRCQASLMNSAQTTRPEPPIYQVAQGRGHSPPARRCLQGAGERAQVRRSAGRAGPDFEVWPIRRRMEERELTGLGGQESTLSPTLTTRPAP